jgi:hypothetical protein
MSPKKRERLVREVDAYAERLVAAGDLQSFKEVFGTVDIDLRASTLSDEQLQEIYDEYVVD